MNYLITGATGFIGTFLLERLLARPEAIVYVLVRAGSEAKFSSLCARYAQDADRIKILNGDITHANVIAPSDLKRLRGKVDHLFHLAAVYDMSMDDATADLVNNEGTRHVVNLANKLGGSICLHHVSSIAVAGEDYVGRFSDSQFDEGQPIHHPYYRTKFESEKIVRDESLVPFRVYRPGAVVGHSQTGEIDKIDGPYYFFQTIAQISRRLPNWLPLVGIQGGRVTMVPVDYVVSAMDYIAHLPNEDGKAFFLIQSPAPHVGEMLQALLAAAHGPAFVRQLNVKAAHTPLRRITHRAGQLLPSFDNVFQRLVGAPPSAITAAFTATEFDDSNTRQTLNGSGISCPAFKDYAANLWQYWEENLAPATTVSRRKRAKLSGKVIVVTGASSGIGLSVAKKLAIAGAHVVLIARRKELLAEIAERIRLNGGQVSIYPCDLNDMEAIDACCQKILTDVPRIDVLINNAGRSIRRSVVESAERFHDFERTMQLNYFGAIRLIQNLLPAFSAQRHGQIINISSIGVLTNAARYSAYVASKAALDAFSRCLASEVQHKHIAISTIYMPLVRTPMIAPTKIYKYAPAWHPEQAADKVIAAIIAKPKAVATPMGRAAQWSYALWPRLNDAVMNRAFRAL